MLLSNILGCQSSGMTLSAGGGHFSLKATLPPTLPNIHDSETVQLFGEASVAMPAQACPAGMQLMPLQKEVQEHIATISLPIPLCYNSFICSMTGPLWWIQHLKAGDA